MKQIIARLAPFGRHEGWPLLTNVVTQIAAAGWAHGLRRVGRSEVSLGARGGAVQWLGASSDQSRLPLPVICGIGPTSASPQREGGKSAFEDATILEIAAAHDKSAAQVMLRWHLQEGRSAIPKSTKSARIAENFDVFAFELTGDEIAALDALDTGIRRGPKPMDITLEGFGREIPEA